MQYDELLDSIEAQLAELRARLDRLEDAALPAPAGVQPPVQQPLTAAPPSRPAQPARPAVDLEDLLGGRVLAWVGGSAVVLGVVFFVAMAVRNGLIDEPTRVVLAFIGSTALLLAGIFLYERRGQTEAAIAAVAASIASLYASLVPRPSSTTSSRPPWAWESLG